MRHTTNASLSPSLGRDRGTGAEEQQGIQLSEGRLARDDGPPAVTDRLGRNSSQWSLIGRPSRDLLINSTSTTTTTTITITAFFIYKRGN
ncbi:hypothetical protein E2C01_097500 [Portunus trituberculatus]|uniref:Uncharacterized protein n=1 Tax=Portunus trituberculatus TaxID=210409 RepID=A0A5B7KA34_PORTR|nr:hypothetical protein [Portunus trituberculatus]